MSVRNFVAHVVGVGLAAAGLAWLAIDVRPDGNVEKATAIGVVVLCSAGWFLIDKKSLADFAAWLFAQAKQAVALVRGGGAP